MFNVKDIANDSTVVFDSLEFREVFVATSIVVVLSCEDFHVEWRGWVCGQSGAALQTSSQFTAPVKT